MPFIEIITAVQNMVDMPINKKITRFYGPNLTFQLFFFRSPINLCIQSDLVNSKLKGPVKKFQLSQDNAIIANSRNREKVQGIDDFELKKFDLTKFNCIFTILLGPIPCLFPKKKFIKY